MTLYQVSPIWMGLPIAGGPELRGRFCTIARYHQQQILACCIRWEHLWAWKDPILPAYTQGKTRNLWPSGISSALPLCISWGYSKDSQLHQGQRGVLCAGTYSSGCEGPGKTEETSDGSNKTKKKLETTLEQMDTMTRRVVMRAVNGKTSGWLNVLPIARHHIVGWTYKTLHSALKTRGLCHDDVKRIPGSLSFSPPNMAK